MSTGSGLATGPDPSTNPSLRYRLPLYPSNLMGAVIMVSLGPLLDPIMKDLGVGLSQAGLIGAGLFVGNTLGIIICNTNLAHVPAKWAIVAGTFLQSIGLVLAGLVSKDLWTLFAAYFVVGACGALVNTTCWIWLGAHMKKNMAASALQMILFFGVGMLVTPVILGPILERGASWRWILVVQGGLSMALALVFVWLPLLDVPGRRNVRLADFRQVLAHNRGLLLGMMGACFMYAGAETTINVWLPKFQIDVFGAGDTWASLSVTLFWVGLVVGRLVIMPLTARFSPARLLLVCAGVLAVFCVALSVSPTQVVALVLSVGAGLGASASYGLIGSYSGRFPGWQSGVASSLFILAGGVGCTVFPYLMGPIASSAGFRIALGTVAVPAVLYGLFSLLIHARSGEART
ncbi:MAG: MFS transporter [Thermoleophilia bacterium]|nr:MFS transporter [Thermoleophilia bacterium]